MRRAFSVAVFVLNGRDVLLIHHKRLNIWLPVGGEIEANETPLEAAGREVKEETGLNIWFASIRGEISGVPMGLLGYEEHLAGAKGLHLNFNFVAWSKSREIVGDGSFTDHVWHPIGDLFVYPAADNTKQYLYRIHRMLHEGEIGGADVVKVDLVSREQLTKEC